MVPRIYYEHREGNGSFSQSDDQDRGINGIKSMRRMIYSTTICIKILMRKIYDSDTVMDKFTHSYK